MIPNPFFDLGVKAFHEGKPSAPALNHKLQEMIFRGPTKLEHHDAMAAMDAYSKGWHQENLKGEKANMTNAKVREIARHLKTMQKTKQEIAGAWGHGVFENDSAMDEIGNLSDEMGFSRIADSVAIKGEKSFDYLVPPGTDSNYERFLEAIAADKKTPERIKRLEAIFSVALSKCVKAFESYKTKKPNSDGKSSTVYLMEDNSSICQACIATIMFMNQTVPDSMASNYKTLLPILKTLSNDYNLPSAYYKACVKFGTHAKFRKVKDTRKLRQLMSYYGLLMPGG